MKKQPSNNKVNTDTDKSRKFVTFKVCINFIVFGVFTGFLLDLAFRDYITHAMNPDRAALVGIPLFALFLAIGGFFVKFRTLFAIVRSYEFAIVILISITIATVAGTMILQQESVETYNRIYGTGISAVIRFLALDNVYHSIWFMNMFFLLSVSLITTVFNRWPITKRRAGFYATHLGIVMVIIGALFGNMFGETGYIDIEEQQTVDSFNLTRRGMKTGVMKPLGFGVLMDRFELLHYDPEFKLYVYKQNSDADRYNVYDSLPITGEPDKQVPGTSLSFHINKIYPDFFWNESVTKKSDAPENPMVHLVISSENGKKFFDGWLQSENTTKKMHLDAENEVLLVFNWDTPKPAEYKQWTSVTPHKIRISSPDNPEPHTIFVEPGKVYNLEKFQRSFHVTQFIPDFTIDLATKKAASKSDQPNNPTIEILITDTKTGETEKTYLFAAFPEFQMTHKKEKDAISLIYEYAPDNATSQDAVLVIGATQKWIHLHEGATKNTGDFTPGIPFMVPGIERAYTVSEIVADGVVQKEPATRGTDLKNPAIDITVTSPSDEKSVLLISSDPQPLYLMNGEYAVVFEKKRDDIKDYKSHLTIFKNNQKIKQFVLEVNNPLSHNGYKLYQSNYDPDNPAYSGIEVVHDPGLPLVYTGFILMVLGILYVFYVKPRIPKEGKEKNALE